MGGGKRGERGGGREDWGEIWEWVGVGEERGWGGVGGKGGR